MTTPPQHSPSTTYLALAGSAPALAADPSLLPLNVLVRSAAAPSIASTKASPPSPQSSPRKYFSHPGAAEDSEISTIHASESAAKTAATALPKRRVTFNQKGQFRMIQIWSDTYERVIEFRLESIRDDKTKGKPELEIERVFHLNYADRLANEPVITKAVIEDLSEPPVIPAPPKSSRWCIFQCFCS